MRSKTWIIQSVKNGFSHRPKEHNSLSEATNEASRLANQNPADEFLIYERVRSVKVQNILIEDIDYAKKIDDEGGYPDFSYARIGE